MKFVQLLLTDEQTELVAAALLDAEDRLKEERADETYVEVTSEQASMNERLSADIAAVGRLYLLFQDASENPTKYPPTGKTAATVRTIVRRSRGQAETPTRSKQRAGRRQRRRAERHIFRRNQEFIDGYNRAVEINEEEQAEHEANLAEVTARVKGQPKFTITDAFGNVLMREVPAEFVLDAEGKTLAPPKIEVTR